MVANMPLACGILQFGEPSFASLRFELIWRKDLLSQQSITLRIPDTIVFKFNCPSVWYFTSVDGTIKRKHKAKLDAEYILREFLKRPLACGIVAYYVQTSLDVDDAQRGLVETGLAPTTIEYLNEEQLRELLFNRQMNRGDGLLQKFLEPPDARNNMIRAQWSPKVCLIERRINRLNLNDTHYDMYERAVTFEGPDFHSEVTPVRGATLANKVDQIADAIIQHVAGVTNDRVKITRLALNFKVDYRDRLHFLFASSVRLQGSSRPLEVNTRLQVPEYIHRAQSVSRTAPAVLLRSLVCPTCQEKVHPEMVFEVVYRVIIEFEEQRRNAERQADSFQEQEEEEVPEAFLRLHPRLTVEEYVELRKELVFQQKFAGVCENCYLRFSTARLGAVQRLLAPELKGGDAAAEKQELGFLGTENAEAVQLVGTGQLDPQRLALRREATRQRILQRQGMEDSWWEAAEPETTNPPRSKSCPKLPSWGPNHKGAVLWAPSPALAHRPRPPAAPAPSGTSLRQALADSPRPQRKPQVRLGAPYLKAIQDFAEQHRHRACEVLGPHAGAEIAALGGAQADIPQPEDLEDAAMERCEPSDKEMEEKAAERKFTTASTPSTTRPPSGASAPSSKPPSRPSTRTSSRGAKLSRPSSSPAVGLEHSGRPARPASSPNLRPSQSPAHAHPHLQHRAKVLRAALAGLVSSEDPFGEIQSPHGPHEA